MCAKTEGRWSKRSRIASGPPSLPLSKTWHSKVIPWVSPVFHGIAAGSTTYCLNTRDPPWRWLTRVLLYSQRDAEMAGCRMTHDVAIFPTVPSFELSTVSHDLVRQLCNVNRFHGAAPQVNPSTTGLWLNKLD